MECGRAEGDREESHVRRGELGRSACRDGGGAEEAEEGGGSVGGERGDHVDRLGDDLAVHEVLRGNQKMLGVASRGRAPRWAWLRWRRPAAGRRRVTRWGPRAPKAPCLSRVRISGARLASSQKLMDDGPPHVASVNAGTPGRGCGPREKMGATKTAVAATMSKIETHSDAASESLKSVRSSPRRVRASRRGAPVRRRRRARM